MIQNFTEDDIVFSLSCMPGLQPDRLGLIMAGCSSGLYRSVNSGLNWENLYGRLSMRTRLPVTAVAFSPYFHEDHTVFAAVAGNVFRSEDSGQHWQGVYIADPLPSITCLTVSPNYLHDGTVFVGTMEDGIFQSTDRGMLWKPSNFGLLDLHVLCLAISPDFANHPLMLVGTDTGLFRSNNGGRAWRDVTLPGGYDPALSLAFSPTFIQDRRVYAGTESKGVFTSTDGGKQWTPLAGELPGSIDGLYPMADARLAVLADSHLFAGDASGNWSPWNAEKDVESICAAALVGNPPVAFAGRIGGDFQWIEQK